MRSGEMQAREICIVLLREKFSFDLRVATSTFCTASGERQNAAPELKNNSIAQPGTYSQTTLIGAAKLVGGNFLVSILN